MLFVIWISFYTSLSAPKIKFCLFKGTLKFGKLLIFCNKISIHRSTIFRILRHYYGCVCFLIMDACVSCVGFVASSIACEQWTDALMSKHNTEVFFLIRFIFNISGYPDVKVQYGVQYMYVFILKNANKNLGV